MHNQFIDNGHGLGGSGKVNSCNLGEVVHAIFQSDWVESNKQEEDKMITTTNTQHAMRTYESLVKRQTYLKEQMENITKEQSQIEAELHRLSSIVPALKRKQIVDKAKTILAEFKREGELIFKEQGDTTVCVDISYEEASVIDEYDVGIRKFTRNGSVGSRRIPKNHHIERVIAAHEALNKTVPVEFINYYSMV